MNELIDELFDNNSITRNKLEEFGKMCQLELLHKLYEKDDSDATYNKVRKSLIELKNELIMDDNKLYIMVHNYSLN